MQPGFTTLNYERTEKIGMPNWSAIFITASVTTTCPDAQHDQAYDFLFQVVEAFIKERVEGVARALSMWANLPTTVLDPGSKQSIVPQGLTLTDTEVFFKTQERVGLPDKSNIDIDAWAKHSADMGNELAALEYIALKVATQMKGKRDIVLANPRPWISS